MALGIAMATDIRNPSCWNGCVEFDSICALIIPHGQIGVNSLDDFLKNCRVFLGIIWDNSVY